MKGNLLWALVLVGAGIGFFGGRIAGKKELRSEFVNNPELVKQVAELADLDVEGSIEITEAGSALPRSYWKELREFTGEDFTSLTVPYQARFGVDLAKSDISLKKGSTGKLVITLERPALKRFEMRPDQMSYLLIDSARSYRLNLPEKEKLYAGIRKEIMNDKDHLSRSRKKIEFTLSRLYAGLGVTVDVRWVK